MKTVEHRPRARDYVSNLAASGRYSFASGDARKALGVSADAAKLALNRLAREQMFASPARGFYVVIPPEYRSLGCLPADQFIPALMQRAGLPYYVGLLSAAQYYGAAHHRPQKLQVMLAKPRRPIHCGQSMRTIFACGVRTAPRSPLRQARAVGHPAKLGGEASEVAAAPFGCARQSEACLRSDAGGRRWYDDRWV